MTLGARGGPEPPAPDEQAAQSTTGRTVLAGAVWNAASLVLPQLYTLVVSITAARYLGPEGMGRQSFISFVQLSLFLLFANGMPPAFSRFASEMVGRQRPDVVRLLLRWTWRIQVPAALVAFAVLALIAALSSRLQSAWLLAGLACAAGVVHSVPNGLLIALQRWRNTSTVSLVTGAAGTAATVAVLAAGGGIVGIFAVEAVVSSVSLLAVGVLARRASADLGADPPVELGPATPTLSRDVGRYAMVSTVQVVAFFIVWGRSEFFFLERWSTASEIAMYSVAFATTAALVRLPQGLVTVIAPAIATLFGADEHARIRAGYERGLRLVFLLSLPMAAGGLAVGPELIRLVYGDPYTRAGDVLLVLLVAFPLLPGYYLATGLLEGLGRIRDVFTANAAATAVNLALDVSLIPGNGAVGAGAANLGAQATGSALVLWLAHRRLSGVAWRLPQLARVALASAGTGAVAYLVSSWLGGWPGLLLAVLGGSLTFACLGRLLRVLAGDDAAWLSQLGGPVGKVTATGARLLSGGRPAAGRSEPPRSA